MIYIYIYVYIYIYIYTHAYTYITPHSSPLIAVLGAEPRSARHFMSYYTTLYSIMIHNSILYYTVVILYYIIVYYTTLYSNIIHYSILAYMQLCDTCYIL